VAWSRRPVDNPDAYIRRVMTNGAISRWRRRRPHERVTAVPSRDVHGVDPGGAVDERDRLWRELLRLPPQQRAILVLRYYEDLSEADICAVLDIAPGAVRSQTAKARNKLRNLIGDSEGVPL
jgi:RNA polymerase sigma factor (sigma-70 family)